MFGTKSGTRVAIYTRVSSEDQVDGYSLEAQDAACNEYAARRDWQVVAIYSDPGRSGKTVYRPGFQQMLQDAEHNTFDVILVHKLDRFSRSILDVLMTLRDLEKWNVSFVSATEDFDFTTPIGKVLLTLLAAFAQWYVDNLAAETRKGKRQRALSGGWNGTLSFGYTTTNRLRQQLLDLGEAFRQGTVSAEDYEQKADLIETTLEQYREQPDTFAVPCPFNADGARLAFRLYSTGNYSDADIAEMLNEQDYRTTGHHGQNPFSKDTVRDMLQNTFYVGDTIYGRARSHSREAKDTAQGAHLALIDRTLFDRCQEARALRRKGMGYKGGRQKADYPLSGLLYSAKCGIRMRGWLLKGERRYRVPAREMSIDCTEKSQTAEVLEGQIEELFQHMKLPDDWKERITFDNKPDPNEKERKRLEKKLERARKLFLLGDLDETEYRELRDEIEGRLNTITPQRKPDLEAAARMLDNMPRLWQKATADEKRTLMQHLFKRLYYEDGRIISAEATPILWTLLDTSFGADGFRTRQGYPIPIIAPGTRLAA